MGPWEFLVWPENWDAVRVLMSCATQWNKVIVGGISDPQRLVTMGLDYAAVETVMRLLGIKDRADTFHRLQVMEAEVLEACAQYARS